MQPAAEKEIPERPIRADRKVPGAAPRQLPAPTGSCRFALQSRTPGNLPGPRLERFSDAVSFSVMRSLQLPYQILESNIQVKTANVVVFGMGGKGEVPSDCG